MNKTRIPSFVHQIITDRQKERTLGRRRKSTSMKMKQACRDLYPFAAAAAAADDDDDEQRRRRQQQQQL